MASWWSILQMVICLMSLLAPLESPSVKWPAISGDQMADQGSSQFRNRLSLGLSIRQIFDMLGANPGLVQNILPVPYRVF
jgi:hypothetical protein